MGAGDADFLARARVRMQDLLSGAGIVVFASHSMSGLQQFCNKGLVLHHGCAAYLGPVDDAIEHYQRLVSGAA
jgi:ABC-type polysaccharide/polyol phosphate transport system ATPase subunit